MHVTAEGRPLGFLTQLPDSILIPICNHLDFTRHLAASSLRLLTICKMHHTPHGLGFSITAPWLDLNPYYIYMPGISYMSGIKI